MSDISSVIRKFNRFELKYLITLQKAEEIKSALRAYLIPDEYGNNDGSYALSSLYYDSPDLRCYWEKEHGIKLRRKLRIRRYETGEPITNPNCKKGMNLSVIGFPSPKQWRTPKGIEVLGPTHFGYNFAYIPIEQKIKD